MLAVFVAGIPTLLAVPRPVAPVELPEPFIEPRALDGVARHDLALADEAERERLDAEVRRVGSALRAYGLAEVANDVTGVAHERREVADAAKSAIARGEAPMARLRAYELRSFLRELRRWEQTGEETDELRELGGAFLDHARRSGWSDGHRLILDDTVRAVLFKKRWMDLTLTRGADLEVTAAEERALQRFLLLHPPREGSWGDAGGKAAAERVLYLAEQYRLRKIEELRALDPSYPADLGRGVVLYHLHRYPLAVEAFRRHLEAHPDGPYALRAENYLRAALGSALDAP